MKKVKIIKKNIDVVQLCAGIARMATYEADCWSGVCYSSGCYSKGC